MDVAGLVTLTEPTLWVAMGSVAFNPLFWNIVARREHRTRFLTRLFGGSPYAACYALALTIFVLGLVRDYLFDYALQFQPTVAALDTPAVHALSLALFAAGSTLVLSSMYKLGITGTYLGDYCGILMKERVVSFPFNYFENPMYLGSTLNFLSVALWRSSAVGIALTGFVFLVYQIAIVFEGPFTAQIYAQRDKDAAKKR